MLSSRALVVAVLFCCSPAGSRPEQKGPDVSGLSNRDALLVNLLYASTLEEKRRSPVARQAATFDFPVVQPSSAQSPPELGSGPAVSTLWFPVHAEQPSPAVSSLQGSAPAVISAPVIHTGQQQSVGAPQSKVIESPSDDHHVESPLPTPPPLPTGAYIDPNVLPEPPGSLKPLPPSNPFNDTPPPVDQSS
ncbi:hypothetical protein M514_24564 [Trichuris suis]|uniref:Uncharacterized protein n=1 Tax=Trichuris suis TaxID=68888 RepID=A0A085N1D0_9BILA|nr:hypothetical protein M514_24564 [Trichuris suis]KHJ41745.1 hypothetical protein D918_08116 [Trichuris suis]